MSNTFRVWIVMNPQTLHIRPPTYLHQSFETAEAEAERLAKENPGSSFHVMASIVAKVKNDVRTISFDDNPTSPSCEVPF